MVRVIFHNESYAIEVTSDYELVMKELILIILFDCGHEGRRNLELEYVGKE